MNSPVPPPSPVAALQFAHDELMAGNVAAARTTLLEALRDAPGSAAAHNLLGFIALRESAFERAESCFREALAIEPENRVYQENLALARSLPQRRPPAEALRVALAADPRQPHLWLALAGEAAKTSGAEAALPVIREGLIHCPDGPQLVHALARALHQLSRLAEAAIHYHHCLKLDDRSVRARLELSLVYQRLLQLDHAERLAREARELAPGSAQAHANLGAVLYLRRRFRRAIACLERALALQPDEPRTSNQLGMVHMALGEGAQAVARFRNALALKPDYSIARSNLMLALLYCDGVPGGEIHREALKFGDKQPVVQAPMHSNPRDPSRCLRVGFVSGDFRRHVVGTFLLPLFARRDRSLMEFFCYSAVDVPDPFTQMLAGHADGWADIRPLDDAALASRIRSDRIDVLIDLSGHTSDNRLSMFGRRPAPVQATWLGYPGTTGARGVDYRLTDAVLDPPGSEAQSTEDPIRLAGGYFCYAPLPDWGGGLAVAELPARCSGRITFGAFNNLAKVSPSCLDAWAEVLRRVPRSRLVCRAKPFDDEAERSAFKDQLARRGLEASRIDAREYLPDPAQHLRIYDEVDIHLDTMPYTGGTTTCDALWMGVPVVTLAGDRPSARLGASVLESLGLADCIAQSTDDYVRIAVGLAGDIDRITTLRAGLRARFTASRLHDASGFAASFERACRGIWQRWCKQDH